MNIPWTKKYMPKKTTDVVGQAEHLEFLKKKISEHKKGDNAVFIYGDIGVGKTCSVYALAEEMDLELVELNSSDVRKKSVLESFLDGVIKQRSLFMKKKLILIDELEGLSGIYDRGAMSAIASIIKESTFPVVLIGDDATDRKYKSLKKLSDTLHYKPLSTTDIYSVLKDICEKEGLDFEESALKQLSRINGGDLRSAINDLQSLERVDSENVALLSDRNFKSQVENSINLVFKTKDPFIARDALSQVDADISSLFLWFEENVSKEYTKPKDLKKALENLSLADVFFGRIRRWQYYRFYVYCYDLLGPGIALSKEEKYAGSTNITESRRPLKIWIYNMANAKKKSIAEKIAEKNHVSTKQAQKNIDFLKIIYKKDKEMSKKISEEYDLDSQEVEWLRKK